MAGNNELSERENEIISLVAKGRSNKEIAQELYISANTVKVHLRNIFAKIEVSSRTEATLYAVRAGMVEGMSETSSNGATKDLVNVDSIPTYKEEELSTLVSDAVTVPLMWWQRPWILGGLIVVLLLTGAGLSRLFQPSVSPAQEVTISPGENRWEERADLPAPRFGQAGVVFDNQIIVIGGETPEGITASTTSYNPETNLWTELPPKPTAVTEVQAAILGGKIYVPGGRMASGKASAILEIFDPSENSWVEGTSLPLELSAYSLAAFEGKLYLFGGWDGKNYSDNVFVYDPDFDQWSDRTGLPTARAFTSAIVIADKIYVMGGFDGKKALDSNLIYLPGRDQDSESPWINSATLPEGRYAMGATYIADKIYILSGIQDNETPAPQLIFLPDNNGWIVRTEIDNVAVQAWSHAGINVVGADIFAIGGLLNGVATSRNISFQALYTISLPGIIK